MTIAVIGQSGMIGSSILKFNSSKHIDFSINQWSHNSFCKQLNTKISNLKAKSVSFDFVWAAGISNNSSRIEVIENEISLIKIFLDTLKQSQLKINSLNYISSAGALYSSTNEELITEFTPLDPLSDYGKSRILIEKIFRDYSKRLNAKLNIFRLSNVYGYNYNQEKNSGLISHLINANLRRKEMNIFVPLIVEQDYIDVEFVARNICNLIETNSQTNNLENIYNLTRNQSNSIMEIINMVDKFMGRKTPYVTVNIDSSEFRKSNLRFDFNNNNYLKFKIQPIQFTIKRLINEIMYENII
jgi:UDP-glucose 4-epimerase